MWWSSWKGQIRSIKVKWAHVQIELGSFKVNSKRIRLGCRWFGVSLVIWGQFKPMTSRWPFGHPSQLGSIWSTLKLIYFSSVRFKWIQAKKYFDIKLDQIDSIMYRSRDFKADYQGCLVTWLMLDSSRDTCLTWELTWSSTCRLWWTKRCSLRLSFGIRIIKIFTSIWWLNDWFIFKKIYFFLFLSSGLP